MEAQAFQPQEQRAARQFGEMKALQDKQIAAANGDKTAIKMIKANRDNKIQIKETEADYVHVAVTSRHLSPDQNEFLTESTVVAIQPNSFEQMIASNAFGHYADAKVVHDPRKTAPESYDLKPFAPKKEETKTTPINDAAYAAREEKLKQQEKQLDEKIEQLNKLLADAEKVKAKTADKKGAADPDVLKDPNA